MRQPLAPKLDACDTASQLQRMDPNMKTSTIPSLRVAPELRAAAESVLETGETLSSFVEHSLRVQIERRQSQREFIARGLAARDESQRTGEYFASDDVLSELDAMLVEAEAKAAK
jgi:predicted transcriptional regulator